MSWVQWGAAQTPGQPYVTPTYTPVSPWLPYPEVERGGKGRRVAPTTQPLSASTTSAQNLARMGVGFSALTGIPGVGPAGAALGTYQDVRNFRSPYGAPQFEGSAGEHFTSAITGGRLGRTLPEQAIETAATINPRMNPADVWSGQPKYRVPRKKGQTERRDKARGLGARPDPHDRIGSGQI